MTDVIDDRNGFYSHVSEAVEAGRRFGRQDLFNAVLAKLRAMSVKYEPDNPTAFHVAEEACRALLETEEALDAPKGGL